jgi:hypothetical protein
MCMHVRVVYVRSCVVCAWNTAGKAGETAAGTATAAAAVVASMGPRPTRLRPVARSSRLRLSGMRPVARSLRRELKHA